MTGQTKTEKLNKATKICDEFLEALAEIKDSISEEEWETSFEEYFNLVEEFNDDMKAMTKKE